MHTHAHMHTQSCSLSHSKGHCVKIEVVNIFHITVGHVIKAILNKVNIY